MNHQALYQHEAVIISISIIVVLCLILKIKLILGKIFKIETWVSSHVHH